MGTFETFKGDLCCVSITSMQDPTSAVIIRILDATHSLAHFSRVFGDPVSSVRG